MKFTHNVSVLPLPFHQTTKLLSFHSQQPSMYIYYNNSSPCIQVSHSRFHTLLCLLRGRWEVNQLWRFWAGFPSVPALKHGNHTINGQCVLLKISATYCLVLEYIYIYFFLYVSQEPLSADYSGVLYRVWIGKIMFGEAQLMNGQQQLVFSLNGK